MGRYFGTDGFRGEANVTLTAEHSYKIGRFLGRYLNDLKRSKGDNSPARVVIGKDTRRSGYMLEYALSAGLTSSGADAYLLHVTTTPSVAYITRTEEFDCGVMISASHNPYYDNGIKLFNAGGEKMDEGTIALIEDYIDGIYKGEVKLATRRELGKTVDYVEGRNRYMGYLISLGKYSFKGIRVGLDCANGSGWRIAKSVFDALGATTFVINASPDGYNINENAGSTHVEGLCALVKEKGLDIGFAFDGDADRCICVDEKGNVVNGDKILYVCGKYLKDNGELEGNTVVATVMSNLGLFKAFDAIGINYATTAVGDKYVHEYMTAHGNMLGGEQSGHIIFSKYATTGDGILTGLKVMEVLISEKMKLSELASPVKDFPQVLKNVRVADKKGALEDSDVKRAVEEVAKELGSDGRILVRQSGTEPLIRVMVEAPTAEICERLTDGVIAVIRNKGYEVK